MNKNIILFIDKFGRTIMGEAIAENVASYTIKNPGVIHVTQNPQTKRFDFQVLPLVLFEVLDVPSTPHYIVKFYKEDISVLKKEDGSNIKVNGAFIKQYDTIFNALANGLKDDEAKQPADPNTLEIK